MGGIWRERETDRYGRFCEGRIEKIVKLTGFEFYILWVRKIRVDSITIAIWER